MQSGGEQAKVDVHGGVWTGERGYELDPTAKPYQVYEMNFAAKVCAYKLYPFLINCWQGSAIWLHTIAFTL